MNIIEALNTLDTENTEHWTADGMPAVAIMRKMTKDDNLTRAQITDADPAFSLEEARRRKVDNEVSSEETEDSTQSEPEQATPEESEAGEIQEEQTEDQESSSESPSETVAETDDVQPDTTPPVQDDPPVEPEEAPLQPLESASVENHPDNAGLNGSVVNTPSMREEEKLSANIRNLDDQINDLSRERDQLSIRIDELQRERDRLEDKRLSEHSHISETKARMEFIQSQNQQRVDKAAKAIDMQKKLGIDPRTLDPRSKIDQAYANKPNRADQRPAVNAQA